MSIALSSPAFRNGDPIPLRYTQDGEGASPPLAWSDVPPGTKELALICDDPDAPMVTPCAHWVVFQIPPTVHELPERLPHQGMLSWPPLRQGLSYLKRPGYDGPAPPRGHGVHHYHFKLYALDRHIPHHEVTDRGALYSAMAGHVLAHGELVGTYERT